MNESGPTHLIRFPVVESTTSSPDCEDKYSALMTPDIVSVYMELGLDPAFAAILSRHLLDLHVVWQGGVKNSYLTVSAHKDPKNRTEWHREAVISRLQFGEYESLLGEAYEKLDDVVKVDGSARTADNISKLALDWIFFELSVDAAGISCYMQHKYDRYVTGFDGSSANWRSDLKICEDYASENYDVAVDQKVIQDDQDDLKAGLAMIMLHDSIIRTDLLASAPAARWIVSYLQAHYPRRSPEKPIIPLSQSDVILKLSSIVPKETRAELAAYVLSLDPED